MPNVSQQEPFQPHMILELLPCMNARQPVLEIANTKDTVKHHGQTVEERWKAYLPGGRGREKSTGPTRLGLKWLQLFPRKPKKATVGLGPRTERVGRQSNTNSSVA